MEELNINNILNREDKSDSIKEILKAFDKNVLHFQPYL